MAMMWLKMVASGLAVAAFLWLGLRKPGTASRPAAPASAWDLARALIAMGIFAGTCLLPWWLMDPGDPGDQGLAFTSMLWMPVVAIVGAVLAWLWLVLTRDDGSRP